MVSARGACPCLLIQTKQQPLVLRAEAKGGNQGYGFKAALLTLLGMGSRKRAHDEWDPRQWHMRCGWWSCLLLIFATQTQNQLRPWKQVASSTDSLSSLFPSNWFYVCYRITRWLEILYFFNPTALLIVEKNDQYASSSTHSFPFHYGMENS